jgi:hypothetical protein
MWEQTQDGVNTNKRVRGGNKEGLLKILSTRFFNTRKKTFRN